MVPGSKTSEAHTKTGSQLDEARIQGQLLLQIIRNQHRHDQPVNTNDTSHNDRNDICPKLAY